jgi:hypothetical protein
MSKLPPRSHPQAILRPSGDHAGEPSIPGGFDGWLLCTWDTDEQPDLWNGRSAGGVIEQALAPRLRVDPCANPADSLHEQILTRAPANQR